MIVHARALLVACALAGCTAFAGPARVDGLSGIPAPVSFDGLLPKNDNETVYIFQIHGINTFDPTTYEDQLLKRIPTGPGEYVRKTIQGSVDSDDNLKSADKKTWTRAMLLHTVQISGPGIKPVPFDHFGIYQEDVFTKVSTKNRIVVFTYFWHSDLWQVDRQYLDDDIAANGVAFPSTQKSWANEKLKVNIMDNGLSDVAGYLGSIGAVERDGLSSALCAMFADAIGTAAVQAEEKSQRQKKLTPDPDCLGNLDFARLQANSQLTQGSVTFDFLSYSLGSRMLFDVLASYDPFTIVPRSSAATDARRFLAHNTDVFFMAANQLPILAIGRVVVSPVADVAKPDLDSANPKNESFFDLRYEKVATSPLDMKAQAVKEETSPPHPITIVAFQDPDDLLGFKATDATGSLAGIGSVHLPNIIDVLHRNTDQYLFFFANPIIAHADELNEHHSRRIILCGGIEEPDGELKPQPCPDRL